MAKNEKIGYATTIGAIAKSGSVLKQTGWTKISSFDLAAEIYCHALAYYSGLFFLNVCASVGYDTSAVKKSSFWKSLANGIDVANGRDTAKIAGVPRYVLFNNIFRVQSGCFWM